MRRRAPLRFFCAAAVFAVDQKLFADPFSPQAIAPQANDVLACILPQELVFSFFVLFRHIRSLMGAGFLYWPSVRYFLW